MTSKNGISKNIAKKIVEATVGLKKNVRFDRIARMVGKEEEILSPQQRAWITRRKNLKKQIQLAAGKKAAETRRRNKEIVAQQEFQKHHDAGVKAAETRKRNEELIDPIIVQQKHHDAGVKAAAARKRNMGITEPESESIPFIRNTLVPNRVIKHQEPISQPVSKGSERVRRSWVTRRGGKSSNKKVIAMSERDWCGKGKSIARNMVVNYFEKYGAGKVLALESPQFLFAKALPKHEFDVYESNKLAHERMWNNAPSNVNALVNGDISLAATGAEEQYDYAFLDFCGKYDSNIERMKSLYEVLENSNYIAATFCTRGHSKTMESYKFEIAKTMQDIFRQHTIENEISYKDPQPNGKRGAPMFTIILRHRALIE